MIHQCTKHTWKNRKAAHQRTLGETTISLLGGMLDLPSRGFLEYNGWKGSFSYGELIEFLFVDQAIIVTLEPPSSITPFYKLPHSIIYFGHIAITSSHHIFGFSHITWCALFFFPFFLSCPYSFLKTISLNPRHKSNMHLIETFGQTTCTFFLTHIVPCLASLSWLYWTFLLP